jgi:hypothetical protein
MTEYSDAYKRNSSFVAQILRGCGGLPLALAVAAAFMQEDPNGWESVSSRLGHDLMNPAKCELGVDHPGLVSVFETSLMWLRDQTVQPDDCSLPWDELYISHAVPDRAFPSAPVCILALVWGISILSAEEVCRKFVKLSLATLSGGEAAKRKIMLHDLQFQHCSERFKGRAVGTGSSGCILSEPAWHKQIIEGLAAKCFTPLDQDGLARMIAGSAFSGAQAMAARADAVVQALMSLAHEPESAPNEYFLKNLVRHLFGYMEGLVVLAKGVLSDFGWLLSVARRQSLSFAASQYCAVLHVVRSEAFLCLVFAHGDDVDCVAVASQDGVIRVYDLEGGHFVFELYDEAAGRLRSIATTSDGCGGKNWLVAGSNDGSVRIWHFETECCVSVLRPVVGFENCSSRISIVVNGNRISCFTYSCGDSVEGHGLHVWDLSSDGTVERYELQGC